MPLKGKSARHPHGSPQDKARRKWTCLKSLKTGRKRMRCGQCHISIFRLCSIAQARFGEVRFSEQETDLERKSLTFIYITQTFSTGNSWGSICLLLVLSYSLRILGTYSNNVISLSLFFFSFFFFLFFFLLRTGLNFDLSKTWLVVQIKIEKKKKAVLPHLLLLHHLHQQQQQQQLTHTLF